MKISIITVNLNGNRFLQQAIDSVVGQNFPDIEYLIIDGGSTDGSLTTITNAAARDGRIKWISGPDMGIADAMNKGILLATGDIVGMLHADDFYTSDDVLGIVDTAFAGMPTAKWVTGGACLVNESGESIRKIRARRYSFRRLVRSNIIIHPSTFILRQALLDAGGFNATFKFAMDYDLWLRLGNFSAPLSLDAIFSSFRIHEGSLSTKYADSAFAEEQLIRTDYLKRNGYLLWPHRLLYLLKKPLNSRLYARIRNSTSTAG